MLIYAPLLIDYIDHHIYSSCIYACIDMIHIIAHPICMHLMHISPCDMQCESTSPISLFIPFFSIIPFYPHIRWDWR